MKLERVLAVSTLAFAIAGCESGDINLSPTNVGTGAGTGGTGGGNTGGATNFCASYVESGQTFQGSVDGPNCVYSALFVSDSKPITVDSITFPALANGGASAFRRRARARG